MAKPRPSVRNSEESSAIAFERYATPESIALVLERQQPGGRQLVVPGFTPNQLPVAKCKNVTVSADSNCMANASIDDGSFDPDGDPMAVNVLTFPAHGSLAAGSGSMFTYTLSNPSWTGTDSFTYQACDNHSACGNTATMPCATPSAFRPCSTTTSI